MSRKACERRPNCLNQGNLTRHVEAFRYQLGSNPLECMTCVAVAPPQAVEGVRAWIMPVEPSPAATVACRIAPAGGPRAVTRTRDLHRVHATFGWRGRFPRRRHAPSPGWAVPRRPRLGQKGSIGGSNRDLGTSECLFVHLCFCLLLLWALLASARGETLTAQAAGSLLNRAPGRQRVSVVVGVCLRPRRMW